MKKLFYHLPALVFTAWTVCLCLVSRRLIPIWQIWNVLMWVGGMLLARGKLWGCIPALIPAGMILYFSIGQPAGLQLATGLSFAVYYCACGLWVWRKKK